MCGFLIRSEKVEQKQRKNFETKRTISCVTFFGLKPSVSAADRCSVDSLPSYSTNLCKKDKGGGSFFPGMKSKRTGRDPAEDKDDDSECDQYVDDLSHLSNVCFSLCLTMRESQESGER